MRPLTQEEIFRAFLAGKQLWRLPFITFIQLSVPTILLAFVMVADVPVPAFPFWLFLAGYLVFKLLVLVSLWRKYLEWRSLLEYDIGSGVAEERLAHVYDRLRYWSQPWSFVLWASAGSVPVELYVDKETFHKIQPGDTVRVAYLPKSRLVLAIARPADNASGTATGFVEEAE